MPSVWLGKVVAQSLVFLFYVVCTVICLIVFVCVGHAISSLFYDFWVCMFLWYPGILLSSVIDPITQSDLIFKKKFLREKIGKECADFF